jgi:hypothetical protein
MNLGRHEEGGWVYPPRLLKKWGRELRGLWEAHLRHHLLMAHRGNPTLGNVAMVPPGTIPPRIPMISSMGIAPGVSPAGAITSGTISKGISPP